MGAEVRVSTPINIASLVKKDLLHLPKVLKPCCKRLDTSVGNKKCKGDDITPGTYDVEGKSNDILRFTKSAIRCAGATCVIPPFTYASRSMVC